MPTTEDLKRHHRHAGFFISEAHRLEHKLKENNAELREAQCKWIITVTTNAQEDPSIHEAGSKLNDLRDRKKSLEEQKTTLAAQITKHLIPISQQLCREFCNEFQVKFPRELRDLVYECLIQPDLGIGRRILIVVEDGRAIRYNQCPMITSPSHCQGLIWPDAPHFWVPEYTGNRFFLELAEHRLISSIVLFDNRFDLFPKLIMGKNRLGLDFKHLIRHIGIEISLAYTAEDENIQYKGDMTNKSLIDRLSKLTLLRKGSHIDVAIRLETLGFRHTNNRWAVLQKLLHVIWPALSMLNSSGYLLAVNVIYPKIVFMPSATDFSIEAWIQRIEDYQNPNPI